MTANNTLLKNNNLNAIGIGKGFALNTNFRYQTSEELPLMKVPDNLFITYTNSSYVGYYPMQQVVPAGLMVIPVKPIETRSEIIPEADQIRTEYALKAVPMKYTIRFLNFASERSKSKTGSSETDSAKIGFSFDISKLFSKESFGEVSGEYQKSFQTAFSYYVDQGKKYLIDLAYIKLVETYSDKLVGLDFIYEREKRKTNTHIADSWMKNTNEEIDKKLKDHFERLELMSGS
jgi:hypothetical protein